jgi:hypothetical protein
MVPDTVSIFSTMTPGWKTNGMAVASLALGLVVMAVPGFDYHYQACPDDMVVWFLLQIAYWPLRLLNFAGNSGGIGELALLAVALLSYGLWGGACLGWLCCLVRHGSRPTSRAWLWVPMVCLAFVVIRWCNLPLYVGFLLHRPALQRLADEGLERPRQVGIYPIGRSFATTASSVQRIPRGYGTSAPSANVIVFETLCQQEGWETQYAGLLYVASGELKGNSFVFLSDLSGRSSSPLGYYVAVVDLGGGWYSFHEMVEIW